MRVRKATGEQMVTRIAQVKVCPVKRDLRANAARLLELLMQVERERAKFSMCEIDLAQADKARARGGAHLRDRRPDVYYAGAPDLSR